MAVARARIVEVRAELANRKPLHLQIQHALNKSNKVQRQIDALVQRRERAEKELAEIATELKIKTDEHAALAKKVDELQAAQREEQELGGPARGPVPPPRGGTDDEIRETIRRLRQMLTPERFAEIWSQVGPESADVGGEPVTADGYESEGMDLGTGASAVGASSLVPATPPRRPGAATGACEMIDLSTSPAAPAAAAGPSPAVPLETFCVHSGADSVDGSQRSRSSRGGACLDVWSCSCRRCP